MSAPALPLWCCHATEADGLSHDKDAITDKSEFMSMINGFNQRTIESLAYYVYALIDPRDNRIFYIGKGKGNRIFQHAKDALDDSDQSLKLDIIRSILRDGREVGLYILRHNLTEETAYVVESVLIDLLTYSKFNKTSILANIAAGHHQWDEGIKDVDEIDSIYNCMKIDINQKDTLLLVILNKSFDQAKPMEYIVELTFMRKLASTGKSARMLPKRLNMCLVYTKGLSEA
jgi:hypothetical protein